MKTLLKFIFRLYRRDILDLAVAEFFHDIPTDIREPAITLMAEHRMKLDKLFLYQAFLLQRRIATSPKQVDLLFGMLLQVKLMRHVLETARSSAKKEKDGGMSAAELAASKEEEYLKMALGGVEKFKRSGKLSTG